MVEGFQVGTLRPGSSVCALDHQYFEPEISPRGLTAFSLTGTLIVPRTDTNPGSKMTRRGKQTNVTAYLGKYVLSRNSVDARSGIDEAYFMRIRFRLLLNGLMEMSNN